MWELLSQFETEVEVRGDNLDRGLGAVGAGSALRREYLKESVGPRP